MQLQSTDQVNEANEDSVIFVSYLALHYFTFILRSYPFGVVERKKRHSAASSSPKSQKVRSAIFSRSEYVTICDFFLEANT